MIDCSILQRTEREDATYLGNSPTTESTNNKKLSSPVGTTLVPLGSESVEALTSELSLRYLDITVAKR